MSDMKIEIEHILLLVIGAFILYHFMSRGCGCNNGFRVGARRGPPFKKYRQNGLISTAKCNERVAEVERESQQVMRELLAEEAAAEKRMISSWSDLVDQSK